MQRFEIADMLMEISCDRAVDFSRFKKFSSYTLKNPDLKIKIEGCRKIERPSGDLIIDKAVKWMYTDEKKDKITIFIFKEGTDKIILLLEVDEVWRNARITYVDIDYIQYAMESVLGSLLFRNSILFKGGFVIHASAVKWKDRGILFSAPSGTGKSTQARLWRDNLGAEIINDDCPCVRFSDGKNYVHGTPWSGSSDEFKNDRAEISAIVMLEQSFENELRRLELSEAARLLMPRCFLPYYDSSTMNLAVSNIERVISKVPIYLLKCRPDMEAVELVENCVR